MADRSTISSLDGARIYKVVRDPRAPGFLVFLGWPNGSDSFEPADAAQLFSIPEDQIFDAEESLFAIDC